MFYALLSGFIKGCLLVAIPAFVLFMLFGGKAWLFVVGFVAAWLDNYFR